MHRRNREILFLKNIFVVFILLLVADLCSAASFSVDVAITNGTILISTNDPLGEITGVRYSIDTDGDGSFTDENEYPYSAPIVINALDLMAYNYGVQGLATNQSGELAADTNNFDHVRLTMPPVVYAVEGEELAIYYSNIMNSDTSDVSVFDADITVNTVNATADSNRWYFTPASSEVGAHVMSVSVRDNQGRLLATVTNQLYVAPGDSLNSEALTLLIVGDSLTSAGKYPLRLATLLNQPGNPVWEMQGQNSAGGGAYHEGYGGYTWYRFVNSMTDSPFVYDVDGGLDFERYLNENESGKKPDIITINLGINDTFNGSTSSLDTIDIKIDTMFIHATTLLDEFRTVCPDAEIGIGITTPANSRPDAFYINYGDSNRIWRWKHIQRRLDERLIAEYQGREDEKIYIIPSHLNLDNFNGFPYNNAVHPNTTGYNQMGDSFYAWLKWRLDKRGEYNHTLPFLETFETNSPIMANVIGPVNGQHGWVASPDSNALVQDSIAYESDQAITVSNAVLKHSFRDEHKDVWISFAWQPSFCETPLLVASNATVVFWINTNGFFSAYSNTTIVTSSQVEMIPAEWVNISFHSNYESKKWSLWVDTTEIFSDLAFYSTSLSGLSEISFVTYAGPTMVIDDIRVATDRLQPKSVGGILVVR